MQQTPQTPEQIVMGVLAQADHTGYTTQTVAGRVGRSPADVEPVLRRLAASGHVETDGVSWRIRHNGPAPIAPIAAPPKRRIRPVLAILTVFGVLVFGGCTTVMVSGFRDGFREAELASGRGIDLSHLDGLSEDERVTVFCRTLMAHPDASRYISSFNLGFGAAPMYLTDRSQQQYMANELRTLAGSAISRPAADGIGSFIPAAEAPDRSYLNVHRRLLEINAAQFVVSIGFHCGVY